MGNRHQRVIDGVEYNIRQDMVRFRKQTWKEWFARKVLAKYIGIPFMSLLAPLWYILVANFGWARELMSSVTWIFMPWLDLSLADVKQELTKDIAGKRVLDVGAGSGDWLRFLEGAESVTELEPDGHRLRILRKTVDEYRSSHPAANIEVAHTTLAKLDVKDPFDVVILANTLCEVADTRAFLAQVDRVLKPGGKVIFQEHIHQPSGTMGGVAQSIFNFLWRRANKGAEVNKDPVELLKATGKWHVEAWDLKVDGALIFDRVAVGVASKSKIP